VVLSPLMSKPKILILGGGFGGVFTALELAGSADVTLVTDADHFLFTPMLYEYLSGEVEAWHIAPTYDDLLNENVRCIQDGVTAIDLTDQSVSLANRQEKLGYDMLVLALGGVTNYAGVEGAEEFSLPFRKLAHADDLRRRMVAARPGDRSWPAESEIRVVTAGRERSLVAVTMRTGVTHQIRVHLALTGHPVVGDTLYGGPPADLPEGRHALHASGITLPHPIDGKLIEVETPLPEDLRALAID